MQPLKPAVLNKAELVCWIADYRDGNLKAFDKFYAATKPLVLAFLRRYLHSQEDVNEAFQEVYFRVHRYVRAFKSELSPVAWLLTIAKNAAIDVSRNSYRAKQNLGERIPYDEAEHADLASGFDLEDEHQVLTILMAGLPAKDREILEKRLIGGMPYKEIGKLVNVSSESVRKRFSRALKKLKSSAS